jgi:AcrR family transcriptional regulator
VGRPSTRAASRQRILDAAERLFAENDPKRVTMVAISKASGVPRSTVYECFPSREAVLLEVISRAAQRSTHRQLEGMSKEMPWGGTLELALDDGGFYRALLRALMSGVDPSELSAAALGFRETLKYFERPMPAQDGFDPRLITAVLGTITVGWQVMERFSLEAVGLAERDVHEVRAELARLMVGMMALAAPIEGTAAEKGSPHPDGP